MTKNDLRSLYRKKRNFLDKGHCISYDRAILKHLTAMNWSDINFVHLYLPMQGSTEPDTLMFVDWLRKTQPDTQLVLSKSNFEKHHMTHYLWDADTVFETNKYGIVEPKGGVIVDSSALDVVLVPLLVVDKYGNRVGYGKGFYDRFLATCKATVKCIGLSYFEPVDEIEDVGDWDVALDFCITPNQIYVF